MLAQDPAYTRVDKSVLEEDAIRCLDDPGGFLDVDNLSVVISIAPDIPVRQVVADIARPTVMVWERVTREEEEMDGWSLGAIPRHD